MQWHQFKRRNNDRAIVIGLFLILPLFASPARSDETHSRYFEQLRQRGLFALAESEAISRLAAEDLSIVERTRFTIELSRTLTEHAGFVTDEQRNEYWQRARTTIEEMLVRYRSNPRTILLNGQLASVFVAEGDWLRAEREIRPFDELLLNQARIACTQAIEQLKAIDKILVDPSRDPLLKRVESGMPLGYELRALMHQVRFQLGQSYRNLAELSPAGNDARTKDLAEAETQTRRLVGAADEPLQSRAKLMLVSCLRLRSEYEKASAALTTIEKSENGTIEGLQDELTAERVRLLLEIKRPTEAAELLLKTRGRRQRLTGELWLLQTRALISLRAMTLEKQQETLSERIAEQIVTTIERCEEQVGGFWGRRCRQLWENAQTSQKYGSELDALMQQARTDFVAGRIDVSLAEYASAEKTATERGQNDIALELGFTRASILLDETRFELAANEFFRLAKSYSGQTRQAKSHILGAYCLGRLYDDKKTQSRREAYTEALDRHLHDYLTDPTINDARFLKAQLEEQRLQSSIALPIYLEVESDHGRALEAMAGAARCYETILRRMIERRLPTEQIERDSVNRLSVFLSANGNSNENWSVTHADIALRLAAILLMSSSNPDRDSKSGNSSGPNVLARCQKADAWLVQVRDYLEKSKTGTETNLILDRLKQRTALLRVVALSGIGNITEAEKILETLPATPVETMGVIDRLTQFAMTSYRDQRVQIATLLKSTAERLTKSREQLSATDSEKLDRCLTHAYITTGETAKAIDIAKRLSEQSSKDVEKQREFAILFSGVLRPDCQSFSKQCWRRVESLTKAGSAEWFDARIGVLRTCIAMNQWDEGQKLMQVTKVLYPELGGESLKLEFENIQAGLRTKQRSVQ